MRKIKYERIFTKPYPGGAKKVSLEINTNQLISIYNDVLALRNKQLQENNSIANDTEFLLEILKHKIDEL